MTTLKRTKPITVSPASQWQHERTQLLEQIQRLKGSLTVEAAQVVQLTAALSTEKDARAQSDEDADTLRGELAQMSADLETAENDALALATGIREQRDIVGYWLMDEEHDSQALEEGILPRLCDAFGKLMTTHGAKYLERETNLRQQIAESVATASEEQIDAGMDKLRAAVAEAWIGEGEPANELAGEVTP